MDSNSVEASSARCYSIEEVLARAKVSRSRLYQEIGARRLRILKIGRRTLVTEWALRGWLEQLERDAAVGSPGTHAAAAASVAKRFGPAA